MMTMSIAKLQLWRRGELPAWGASRHRLSRQQRDVRYHGATAEKSAAVQALMVCDLPSLEASPQKQEPCCAQRAVFDPSAVLT
jgi:hypothetical protein